MDRADHIGGVSMSLGTPIEVAAKINNMQRLSRVPLLASADLEPGLGRLEGGTFTHYLLDAGGATVFPSAMAIAATGRDQDAYDVAKIIGAGSARRRHPDQLRAGRRRQQQSVEPGHQHAIVRRGSAARRATCRREFVRGTQDGGAVSTAKHFPGHGDTDVDSHVGLPVVGANWTRLDTLELVPFRAAIDAGAGMVMTAHIALPAVEGDSTTPATLAPKIITGVLRDSLRLPRRRDHRRDDDGRRRQGLQRGGELRARREGRRRHHPQAERSDEGDRRGGGGGGAWRDLARRASIRRRGACSSSRRARAWRSTRSSISMPYARSSARRSIARWRPTSRARAVTLLRDKASLAAGDGTSRRGRAVHAGDGASRGQDLRRRDPRGDLRARG